MGDTWNWNCLTFRWIPPPFFSKVRVVQSLVLCVVFCICDRSWFWLSYLGPLGFFLLSKLYIIWLSNLSILSVTWWKLFQKRVVRTKFDIFVFIVDHSLSFVFFILVIILSILSFTGSDYLFSISSNFPHHPFSNFIYPGSNIDHFLVHHRSLYELHLSLSITTNSSYYIIFFF